MPTPRFAAVGSLLHPGDVTQLPDPGRQRLRSLAFGCHTHPVQRLTTRQLDETGLNARIWMGTPSISAAILSARFCSFSALGTMTYS